MQPTSTLYVSPLLTNISLGYKNDNYIAEIVFPIVQVKKDTGKITTYGMDNLRIADSERSIGSGTNEVGHSVSIGAHYSLTEHALKELVPDEHIEQADSPINPKIDATENVTDRLLVEKEKALADALTSSSIVTQYTTLSGTDQWSDYANSDPITDIRTGVTAVRTGSGKKANTIIFSKDVYDTLLDHPDILERIKYVQAADKGAVAAALGRIFGVDKVLVGDAQYNSAAEGITDALSDVWTKDVVICYIDSKPTLKSRSIGFTYQMKAPRMIDEWRDDDRKGVFVRGTDKYDQQIVDATCAYLIQAAIA